MSRRKSTVPYIQPKQFESIEEIDQAIAKLRRRVADVKDLARLVARSGQFGQLLEEGLLVDADLPGDGHPTAAGPARLEERSGMCNL